MSAETLNPTAAEALAKLERAFLPLDIVRAVTRYEAAAFRYDELVARSASTLSPAEFDAIGQAQQAMADAFGALAEAGQTRLLAPLEVATRYRYASELCSSLSKAGDVDGCLNLQDEMAMCRCQLAKAGRLDLIGGV
jgi:hypothetical protein